MERYVIIDSANVDSGIVTAKKLVNSKHCLFDGIFKNSDNFSPYLFGLNYQTEFENWHFDNCWGYSASIILFSETRSKKIIRDLQNLLIAKAENNKEYYFRIYDPRILRIFLPTCDNKQLSLFFNNIDYFVCEDEDPEKGLVFSLEDEVLVTKTITKEEVQKFNPEAKKKRFSFF